MRIGFACKIIDRDGQPSAQYSFRSMNKTQFLNHKKAGAVKLREVVNHNLVTLHAVICRLGHLEKCQRMFRISNDVLPLLDLEEARHVYDSERFAAQLKSCLRVIGNRAQSDRVRLSTHPDQFIVPSSQKPHVRAASVNYLLYWQRVAKHMGYKGLGQDDFCINIHLGPKYDTTRDLAHSWAALDLPDTLRNIVTIENNDTRWTIHDLLYVCRLMNMRPVIDVHHHWCVTGEWLEPTPKLVDEIETLWDGRRPKMHFSMPCPEVFGLDYLDDGQLHDRGLPPLERVKGASRPHARIIWTTGMAKYLARWSKHFDIMLELKDKNNASIHAFKCLNEL